MLKINIFEYITTNDHSDIYFFELWNNLENQPIGEGCQVRNSENCYIP